MNCVNCEVHGYVETDENFCPKCNKSEGDETFLIPQSVLDASPYIGWQCPLCKRVWAPSMLTCGECEPKKKPDKNVKLLLEEVIS